MTVGGVVVVILIVVALFLSGEGQRNIRRVGQGHSYELRFMIDQFRVRGFLDAEQARRGVLAGG